MLWTTVILPRLIPLVSFTYAFQLFAALIFVPLKTEFFFDVLGSLGFLSMAFLSLYFPWLKARYWDGWLWVQMPPWWAHAPRQLLLTSCLTLWASRLGSFLFQVSTRSIPFPKKHSKLRDLAHSLSLCSACDRWVRTGDSMTFAHDHCCFSFVGWDKVRQCPMVHYFSNLIMFRPTSYLDRSDRASSLARQLAASTHFSTSVPI